MKTKILALAVVFGCLGVSWAERSGQEQVELMNLLQDKGVGYDGLKAGNSDSFVLASAGGLEPLAEDQTTVRQIHPGGLGGVPEPAKESKNPTRTKGILTFFLGGALMFLASVFKSQLGLATAMAGGLTAIGAVIAIIGIIYMITAPDEKAVSEKQASANRMA